MSGDTNRTAALARKAQEWLEERTIPLTPDNFELAYAYVEGGNAELKRCFDSLVAVGCKFDEDVMQAQHERFFSAAGDKSMTEYGEKITVELDSVLQLLATAGRNHSAYRQSLSTASGELEGKKLAQDAIKALVNQMISATRTMEVHSKELETQLQSSAREVTDLRDRLEASQQVSLTDHLTAIANRRAFDIELKTGIERSRETAAPLSLVIFDIDHFKLFNDTWGHQTGDQVLRFVANCISESLKSSDTGARYGGEEFAVILPSCALADAVEWAGRICRKVGSKRLIKRSTGGQLGAVTISAGAAQLHMDESAAQLVRRADTCLYAAKHAGRNRVVCESDKNTLAAAETEAA
jgi:diguanylate cyclase